MDSKIQICHSQGGLLQPRQFQTEPALERAALGMLGNPSVGAIGPPQLQTVRTREENTAFATRMAFPPMIFWMSVSL